MSDDKSKVFYRLGAAPEKELFKSHRDTYYGVTVSAHIAAYYIKSIRPFLQNLKKPFFVDPVTYHFARNLKHMSRKEGNLKKSFEKLLEHYGDTFREIVLNKKRTLETTDFVSGGSWNEEFIEELCENVLAFQKNIVKTEDTPLTKLLDYAGKKSGEKIGELCFLVPPYFYASSIKDGWYEISKKIAKSSLKFKDEFLLYPVICISKDMILDKKAYNTIKEDYKDFDGLILWISNFDGNKEDEKHLEAARDFISSLAELNKPIITLYGGYFFALMSKFGLSGYSSGICYGESKDVDFHATGGGFPQRYYVPFIRVKVPEADARSFYVGHPQLLCGCPICSTARDSIGKTSEIIDQFFDKIKSQKLVEKHFLACKYQELTGISKSSIEEISQKLINELKDQQTYNLSLYKNFNNSHMSKWSNVLVD